MSPKPKEFDIPPQQFISPIATGNYDLGNNEIKVPDFASVGEIDWVDERESMEQQISNLKLELMRVSQERDKLQRSQDNAAPAPHLMYGALQEEIQSLRKKLVSLETADFENEDLRKDFKKLRIASQEEKSILEADFMNQLTAVGREHALRLEELEGSLQASNDINRALTAEYQAAAAELEAKIQEVQRENEKEIERLARSKKEDIARLEADLRKVEEELKDALTSIELGSIESKAKDKEIMLQRGKILQHKTAIKAKEMELEGASDKLKAEEEVTGMLRSKLDESETNSETLEHRILQLQKELDESLSTVALGETKIKAKKEELSQIREQMDSLAGASKKEISTLESQISQLQEQVDEIRKSEVMALENRVIQLKEELAVAMNTADLAEQEAQSSKSKISTLENRISELEKEQGSEALVDQMKSKLAELEDEKRSTMKTMKEQLDMFRKTIAKEKKKTRKLEKRVKQSHINEALLEEAEMKEKNLLEEKRMMEIEMEKIQAENRKIMEENKLRYYMMKKMLDKLQGKNVVALCC